MNENVLKIMMEKEIHLMRELLANLLQEELSLQLHDHTSIRAILSERDIMTQELNRMRAERVTMENKDPTNNSTSCEILFLSEQIAALTKKMHMQNQTNALLSTRVKEALSIKPLQKTSTRRLRLQVMPKPKKHFIAFISHENISRSYYLWARGASLRPFSSSLPYSRYAPCRYR